MCYKVLRMRIEPNATQRDMMDCTIGYNRYVFNYLITANKLAYAEEERKARSRLRHHHEKMVNKRKENIERISKEIVDDNDIIVMEKLNVKKLWNRSLSKSMTRGFVNSSLGLLRNRIQSKAECAGKRVIEVDPRGTSQMCSQCGAEVKKKLDVRIHMCPCCGLTVDRDVNAAINILHRGWTGHPVPAKDESPTAMIGGEARTETFTDRSAGSLRCVKVRLETPVS